jgi:hypothetical protein
MTLFGIDFKADSNIRGWALVGAGNINSFLHRALLICEMRGRQGMCINLSSKFTSNVWYKDVNCLGGNFIKQVEKI